MTAIDFTCCDLLDANEALQAQGRLAVLPPLFKSYGALTRFAGPAHTLKVFEDNALVRAALEQAGAGRVLVVDGGGSLRTALVGGKLGQLAQDNGWAGLLVFGCIRDAEEINACRIGVRALNTMPQKSSKQGFGSVGAVVDIAGVKIAPGDWIYADADGVLAAAQALHA
ncbi:ribonuclease E activity regulator RraA [Massilia sp. W12]|uniref:ribonuclease E activity regulator RraA n=1 Tax=Massilia sp. W12 TaxID=3126507 RepID=UPI0030CF0131